MSGLYITQVNELGIIPREFNLRNLQISHVTYFTREMVFSQYTSSTQLVRDVEQVEMEHDENFIQFSQHVSSTQLATIAEEVEFCYYHDEDFDTEMEESSGNINFFYF